MEELFRLVRMPLLPMPLALWTAIWPLAVVGSVFLVIPVGFIGATVIYSVGFPFMFLGAAYSNEPERVRAYLFGWRQSYGTTLSVVNKIQIARGYSRIFEWGNNPNTVPDTGWIIGTANAISVLLIGVVISEIVRMAVGIVLAALVILIVTGLVAD